MEHERTSTTGRGIRSRAGWVTALLLSGALGFAVADRLRLGVPVEAAASAQAARSSAAELLVPWLNRLQPPPPKPSPEELERRAFAEGLQRRLEEQSTVINGDVRVHVRLTDGTEAGIGADQPVAAASVIKVPVMAVLYEAWEDGTLERTPADERCLRLMITRSSNRLTNVLIKRLGMGRINTWLQENGYRDTSLRSLILAEEPYGPSVTTAREMTAMLEAVRRRELVNPNASQEMRQLLLAQRWRERVPAGIPAEARVGNKTGTMQGLLHDVAFVEPPNGPNYTFAILIERENRAAVRSEAIAELSRAVYEYVTDYWPGHTAGGVVGMQVSASPRAGAGSTDEADPDVGAKP